MVVLIIQKRRDFTEKLFLHADNGLDDRSEIRTIIKGLYGKELNLKSYDTVLLFVTDIRIADQLLNVTQLLKEYHNCEVKTQRITLF